MANPEELGLIGSSYKLHLSIFKNELMDSNRGLGVPDRATAAFLSARCEQECSPLLYL